MKHDTFLTLFNINLYMIIDDYTQSIVWAKHTSLYIIENTHHTK